MTDREAGKPREEDLALARRAAVEIRKLYPEAEVILYGSRARGNPETDSDMDLLVLVDQKLNLAEEMEVVGTIYDLQFEANVIICPIVEQRERWYSSKYQVMPLAQAIREEGIRI